MPLSSLQGIAKNSKRNLRGAVLQLQACRMNPKLQINPQAKLKPEWKKAVAEIASNIMKEQSPRALKNLREKIYELLVNCIPSDLIVKVLLDELLLACSPNLQPEIVHWVAYYENKMQQGSKPLWHMEAMISKIMVLLKENAY